jgi:Protein of unknown function (DUF2637)
VNAAWARNTVTWLMASGVAAIAAVVSYNHIFDLARAHGGTGTAARLLPLSVDMLIVVGELMLLHEGDRKEARFVLGWVLVVSGIAATMAANITYGAQFGVTGAVIWGWPAYSFILVAAGMVAMVRRAGAVNQPVHTAAPAPGFTDAETAAAKSLRDTAAAGNPWTLNALKTNFRLTRSEAAKVYGLVLPSPNGHHAPEPEGSNL